MRTRQRKEPQKAKREQIQRSQYAYSESLHSINGQNNIVGAIIPVTVKIEKFIMDQVYLKLNSNLCQSISRFEMIPTEPTTKFVFLTANGIFKGRYICKNPQCTQEKRRHRQPITLTKKPTQNLKKQMEVKVITQEIPPQSTFKKLWTKYQEKQANDTQLDQTLRKEEPQETKQFKNWSEWWKTTQRKEQQNQKLDITKNESTKDESKVKLQVSNTANQSQNSNLMPPGRQNTQWSSSLSYVTLHYSTFPVPLCDFKKVFLKDKKKKLQIYFFISVLGQKCIKCESEEFVQPFFGEREQKRMGKNFGTYIYNQIYGSHKKYECCKLRRLKKHEGDYCEACYRGVCGKDDLR